MTVSEAPAFTAERKVLLDESPASLSRKACDVGVQHGLVYGFVAMVATGMNVGCGPYYSDHLLHH